MSIEQMKLSILEKLNETPGVAMFVNELPGHGTDDFARCLLELDGDGLIEGMEQSPFGDKSPFGRAKISGRGLASLRS